MSFRGYRVDAIDVKNKPKGDPVFFDILHPNCFLTAKKNSGKSNLIYHIIRNITGPPVDIYIFCSTATKDPTYIQMIKELKRKGHNVEVYDGLYESIKEGKRRKTVNHLERLLKSFNEEDGEEPEEKEIKGGRKEKEEQKQLTYERILKREMFGDDHLVNILFKKPQQPKQEEIIIKEKPKRKIKKSGKKLYSQRIFIFDDVSEQLKDPFVASLIKKNRHYLATCILSSQFPLDIHTGSRANLDIVIAWGGHNKAKVEVIRKMADTNLDEDEFYKLYKYCTAEKYSFMYCNARNNEIWRNFDELVHS